MSETTLDKGELFGSTKGSFEDCDQKCKVGVVEGGEKGELGSSTSLRRSKR